MVEHRASEASPETKNGKGKKKRAKKTKKDDDAGAGVVHMYCKAGEAGIYMS
jgi:hypothetical protein